MKKFYKTVSVGDNSDGEGFVILLDDRRLKTPLKKDLILFSKKLADKIAKEWDSVGDDIDAGKMPFMSLASTHIDKIHGNEDLILPELKKFISSDTVLFLSDDDDILRERQNTSWVRLLTSFKEKEDLDYTPQQGFTIKDQSDDIYRFWDAYFQRKTSQELNAYQYGLSLIHSPLLFWGYENDILKSHEVYEYALLEELYQLEKWGSDEEADKRREALRADLSALLEYLDIVRS